MPGAPAVRSTGMVEAARAKPRAYVQEKRRFQRVRVNLLGRFMASSRHEYPCQIVDMSPGGAAMITPVTPAVGERVVVYIDHIGRVEGRVARTLAGGFAIELRATSRKRDKLASQLTWLANQHRLNLPEDRRHERVMPENPITQVVFADGTKHRCRVLDMSLSGAALSLETMPPVGQLVTLGRVRARVVRHIEGGIAIEFSALQTEASLTSGTRTDPEAS